jgi:hypothetical protein
MFCTNCGKNIGEDSKFCQFCGTNIGDKKDNDKKETETTKSTATDNLWDKFVEVYNSKGEERKKYEDQFSNEAWELINRLSINAFESFIKEHKEVLNKQPYKTIEALKSSYQLATAGGYWLWMAETLLKKGELGKLKPIELEKFIEEWKRAAIENYTQTSKKFSEELITVMSYFHNFRMEALFETAPSLKDLPNEFIEKLKSNLIMQIVWGYIIGQNELAYRK